MYISNCVFMMHFMSHAAMCDNSDFTFQSKAWSV